MAGEKPEVQVGQVWTFRGSTRWAVKEKLPAARCLLSRCDLPGAYDLEIAGESELLEERDLWRLTSKAPAPAPAPPPPLGYVQALDLAREALTIATENGARRTKRWAHSFYLKTGKSPEDKGFTAFVREQSAEDWKKLDAALAAVEAARFQHTTEPDPVAAAALELAEAVQAFRNLPMLGRLVKLRATPEYVALCRAWKEFTEARDTAKGTP